MSAKHSRMTWVSVPAGVRRWAGPVLLTATMLLLSPVGPFQLVSTPEALALEQPARSEPSEQASEVDSLLARAGRAAAAGDATAAESLFEEVLDAAPGEHRALNGLAIVGLIEGDPDRAIEYARKAVKAEKGNSHYHFILANGYGMKAEQGGFRAMFYGGKFKKECELAVEYDPENVDAHLALLYFSIYAPSVMGGGMDRAKERAETIASIDEYYGHLAHAVIAKREDDPESAEASYLAAAAVDSMNAEGWSLLGTFYRDTDRPLDAVPAFQRVRELTPDDLVAVYQLASAHAEAGDDLAAAEEGFKAYIAAEDRPEEPELASAHWRLGLVYEAQGRYQEAMAELDLAIELNPEHVTAIESKARLEAVQR
ncbi:MAG: tetratricopeptide repeat protein [Candidatus Eisenbacteria bacterium]